MKKFLSIAAAFLCIIAVTGVSLSYPENSIAAATVQQQVNIGIDFNGNENRTEARSEIFEDWNVAEGQESSYTVDGITFRLSNASDTGTIVGAINKTLANATGTSPVLTMDGVRFLGLFSGGVMKLEISGLPAGTHTFTSWHSYFYTRAEGKEPMKVTINGKEIGSDYIVPFKIANDDDACIVYTSFEAVEGETVEIYFSSEKDVPVLNAIEIDGVYPLRAIKNAYPTENETHFEPDRGFSWTPAADAVSHDVYIGEDYTEVFQADRTAGVFQGNQTEASFDAKNMTFSHMKTYYWRVDEVFADGSIEKGKVMAFSVVHLAFPTAEGYGRFARGGRGGEIIEVTNLNDSGEGSLRWAIEEHTGPRIIVFKVGGIIQLKSKLIIDSTHGNVYIAGQTAPGDGIMILNYSLGMMGAKDVVIRDVRVRVGDMSGSACDGMGMSSSNHCIIDHCSIAWTTDEGFSSRSADNITFQWNIIAESLNNSVHYDADDREQTERHGFAGSISGRIGSFHHNLLVDNAGRNWSLAGALESDGTTYEGYLDITNNVVYNWQHRTNDGGVRQVNIVNNYYKMGPASERLHILKFDNSMSDKDTMYAYVSGNAMINLDGSYDLSPQEDAWEAGKAILNPYSAKSDTPLFESFVKTQTAEEAYESVVNGAGANYPAYDYLDTRYIKETKEGSYTYSGFRDHYPGIIDSQEDAGGYPTEEQFSGGEAPADSDHDGMPDAWEQQHGLNPNDYYDAGAIYLSDEGYTNIEMYLNELMGDPVHYSDDPVLEYEPERPLPAYQQGDANQDGAINASDALLVLQCAARLQTLTAEQQQLADVDHSTLIDAGDALMILQYAARLIDSF